MRRSPRPAPARRSRRRQGQNATLPEDPAELGGVRPTAQLPRAEHRRRGRGGAAEQAAEQCVEQVPLALRLVVDLRLIQEGLELLPGQRPAPGVHGATAGELHDDGERNPRLLRHEKRRAVAAQLRRALPRLKLLLESAEERPKQASGQRQRVAGAQHVRVRRRQPNPVLALQVPELVREDGLDLLLAHHLEEGRVDDDEGPAALPRQRVGLGLGAVPDVDLRHVLLADVEHIARRVKQVVQPRILLLANEDGGADVVLVDLALECRDHLADGDVDARQAGDGSGLPLVQGVAEVRSDESFEVQARHLRRRLRSLRRRRHEPVDGIREALELRSSAKQRTVKQGLRRERRAVHGICAVDDIRHLVEQRQLVVAGQLDELDHVWGVAPLPQQFLEGLGLVNGVALQADEQGLHILRVLAGDALRHLPLVGRVLDALSDVLEQPRELLQDRRVQVVEPLLAADDLRAALQPDRPRHEGAEVERRPGDGLRELADLRETLGNTLEHRAELVARPQLLPQGNGASEALGVVTDQHLALQAAHVARRHGLRGATAKLRREKRAHGVADGVDRELRLNHVSAGQRAVGTLEGGRRILRKPLVVEGGRQRSCDDP
mmetsp:Transcript_108871/g.314385  ORF Transcript_108871/g.314385 Transcript_108871/m.314385 type:complete len:608 (-) Transcript_108871:609-2432(-)